MQIVIPMSGFGERFRRAGYVLPKPLIEIDGKPIIAHIIDMFPGEDNFIFICNRDHLTETTYCMEQTIRRYCPTARVVGIDAHKLGPVHAVLQIADLIDPLQPVVVNYADFTCYWDWAHFREFVKKSGCHGAIPAYKGFHPHSLGTTNYAYMREENGWVLDIQEKQPYTDNRMEEYASSGTYYFASGQIMLDAFRAIKLQDLNVGGEYYVSLAFKPILLTDKKVAVYDLQHFMQWGTPEDVAEYRMWSDAFRNLADPSYAHVPRVGGVVLIPMAGLGERFIREGYLTPKPLISVSGKPMVVQAAADLPVADHHVFVLRQDMAGSQKIVEFLQEFFPNARCVMLDDLTDGQARTALLGWHVLFQGNEDLGPLTIAPCDSGALYKTEYLHTLLNDVSTDVIVWVTRGYTNAIRNPNMYGWVECKRGTDLVSRVSVKKPLTDTCHDPIIIGTFTFRCGRDFIRAVDRMIARDARVNGEYYIDTCIEDALALGLKVRILEVDSYLCWGTPNDLRTFEYWQSCFSKWQSHPYQLEHDTRLPLQAQPDLYKKYAATMPQLPKNKL